MPRPRRAGAPSIYTRPNRKYFGSKRGLTWLNMINDQGVGLGAKVVTGTVRDSLHMIDVLFRRDGGRRPEVIVTDIRSEPRFALRKLVGKGTLRSRAARRRRPGADCRKNPR
ncbi:Tn3 family transposase [Microtetraspora sp. AC03309]|uniref:Tn3 family transposase n=1 Tax=Microtetraspora sp. AC03309 TaxID=2779376 RepID=UPI0035B2513E